MGWHDEEDDWWPDWATGPVMWTGCLMAAALPAGVCIGLWNAMLPDAPPAATLVTYLVSLGLMVAAIKPWSVR